MSNNSLLPYLAAYRTDGSAVTWQGPLAALCEGLHERADGAAQWGRYMATGEEPDALGDTFKVEIRALAAGLEADECEREAGPPIVLSPELLSLMYSSAPERDLTDAERKSAHEYQLRHKRLVRAQLKRCLVSVSGERALSIGGEQYTPYDALELLPPNVFELVFQELAAHLRRISSLTIEGKAQSGQR